MTNEEWWLDRLERESIRGNAWVVRHRTHGSGIALHQIGHKISECSLPVIGSGMTPREALANAFGWHVEE